MSPFRGQLSGKHLPASIYASVVPRSKHKGVRKTYNSRLRSLRTTPAKAANVTKRLWKIGDIAKVLEDWEKASVSA